MARCVHCVDSVAWGNILHTVHTSCHLACQATFSTQCIYLAILSVRQHSPHSAHILPSCLSGYILHTVHISCHLVCHATFSTQCTHLATRFSSITTATTGQTTIGSGTQSDLLMMGIKMPETC